MDNAQVTTDLGEIARLYVAYFKRNPEIDGLNYWYGRLKGGTSKEFITKEFYNVPEATEIYADLDNGQFVDTVYSNVFDREPDAGGREFWIGQLDTQSRSKVLLRISDSDEFRNKTNEYFDKFTEVDGKYTFDPIPDALPAAIQNAIPDMLNLTYESNPLGSYTEAKLDADLNLNGIKSGATNVDGLAQIISDNGNNALEVTYAGGKHKNGVQFYVYNEANPTNKVLYFSYKFKLGADYDFSKGVKFPGAGGNSPERQAAYDNPTGGDEIGVDMGFSYRIMTLASEGNKAGQYIYNQYVDGDFRAFEVDGHPVFFEREKQYQVDQKIVMNDPGQSNGSVTTWINGVKVFHEGGIVLSQSGSYGANSVYIDMWHGGSTDEWGPAQDVKATFDDFKASTSPITAGLVAPNDFVTTATSMELFTAEVQESVPFVEPDIQPIEIVGQGFNVDFF